MATETWMFCVGMVLFSCGVSGYSGLKFVLHYDMVGGKHMQYIITFVNGLQSSLSYLIVFSSIEKAERNIKPCKTGHLNAS